MLENIKLIFCDIDGTLIDDQMECPLINSEAIKRARTQGVMFGFASGRPALNALPFSKKFRLENNIDVVLGANGAEIYYPKEDILTKIFTLKPNEIKSLVPLLEDLPISVCIYDERTLITNKVTPTYLKRCALLHLNTLEADLKTYPEKEYSKVLIINEKGKQKELMPLIRQRIGDRFHVVSSDPVLIEVYNPQLSKAVGIHSIAEHYGLKAEEILCFGDAENDLEMIAEFCGVAMANADQEIKKVAQYQTLSNNEGGVGYFIDRYINKHTK